MSAMLLTIARAPGTKSLGASLRILDACWQRIARYFLRRAAIARRELDDALRDIGLARSQIEAAVHSFITPPNQARK